VRAKTDPRLVRVERWGAGGWHDHSVEWEGRLTVEGVEGHHHYSAARAAAVV
jgi:hypothetical protein